jgi:dihydroxyacetone kinase-like protein
MKKLINNPNNVVEEMLEGFVMSYPLVKKIKDYNIIIRNNFKFLNKVTIISGGGSGHEPSHVGFIGKGMLTAAVVGNVFSSPTPQQILTAIR